MMMVIQPKSTPLGNSPASLERVRKLDEEIDLPDTDVGKCGVGRERVGTDMVGRTRSLDSRRGGCSTKEVVITAASTTL